MKYNNEDADRVRFYQSKRWQQLRLLVLNDNSICEGCNKEYSFHIHHSLPLHTVKGWLNRLNVYLVDGTRNLVALCESCHMKIKDSKADIAQQERIDSNMDNLNDFT